jgi:hypothetical protein
MAFVILQEQAGRQHWIRIDGSWTGFTAVLGGPPPEDLHYSDRAAAERDAETLRARNARDVEATKTPPQIQEEPATYTVVFLDDYARFLNPVGSVARRCCLITPHTKAPAANGSAPATAGKLLSTGGIYE